MIPEIYQDAGGKWRWRIKGRNGRIMAASGESFASKRNAQLALRTLISRVNAYEEARLLSERLAEFERTG